jgi:hypothetical protein
MVQFKNKKVIILLIICLLLAGGLFWFLTLKPDNKINSNSVVYTPSQKRMMTNSEKELVGIPQDEEAEVINDEAGFFIYNVVE